MTSRMPRSIWAVMLAAYALLASAAYVFIGGTPLAPCSGGVGPDRYELGRRCAEQWLEARPLWDKLFSSPLMPVVVFVALVLVTAWLTRLREPRPGQVVQGRSV